MTKPIIKMELSVHADLSAYWLAKAMDQVYAYIKDNDFKRMNHDILKIPSQLMVEAAPIAAVFGLTIEIDFSYDSEEWCYSSLARSKSDDKFGYINVWSKGA